VITLHLTSEQAQALLWASGQLRACKTPERPHLDAIERALKGEIDERT
jgi:hypothetical protein